ncbi:MAG: hypothetical protein JNJ83_09225 [Verrucomicrobiaceae bacterium]|nr:hypothetical protein [Verrucomicrobiaceae bacterium]
MNRLLLSLFAAAFCFCLVSCDSFDVKHPTVSQMDELDVQWGLSRRVPKGGAKRLLNAETAAALGVTGAPADGGSSPPASAAPSAPAPAAATMPTNPAASAPATNTVDPSVINTLR